MDQEQLKDKIEAYLSGTLSPEEQTAFETEMSADPDLRERVDWQRLERDAMEVLAEDDLRRDLARWQAELPKAGKLLSPSSPIRLIFFVVLMLGLFVAAWLWWPRPATQPTDIPPTQRDTLAPLPVPTDAEKGKPIANEPALDKKSPPKHLALALKELGDGYKPDDQTLIRTAQEKVQKGRASSFQNGLTAYSEGDYQKAIVLLKQVPEDDSTFIQANELLAHSFMKTEQYSRAVPVFRRVVATKAIPYSDRSQWYILLAYLADGQEESPEFKQGLQQLVDDKGHDYQKKAKSLREKLSSEK